MSKLDIFIDRNDFNILQCPLCKSSFTLKNKALYCCNNHTFNINKKGFINLEPNNCINSYSEALFKARNTIFTNKHYNKVFDLLNNLLNRDELLLDLGCGDGFLLNYLDIDNSIGIDLSSDGIKYGNKLYPHLNFFISDVSNIPFIDDTFNNIVNILSPINYDEVRRVLKEDGILIKVIPNKNYLIEIREIFNKLDYDESIVYNHLATKMNIVKEYNVSYKTTINDNEKLSFLRMSPLTWSINDDDLLSYIDNLPNKISIDLKIIICNK